MSIGLIGCGMGGQNIARNRAQLEVLASVADRHAENAAEFGSAFAAKPVDVDTLIHDQSIDGIVIATAAPSHDALAIAALAAGKHVYVEKPLSLTLAGEKAIQDAAHSAKKQVMVGHLIRYHAAFIELQKQLAAGAIGSLPTKIHCAGASHMTPNIVDFLTSFMGFENGVSAGMQTSWLSPFKEHRLTVTGTAGSLVFDDTKPWPEKLTLFQDQMRLNGEHFIIDRASPIALPVPEAEPLKDEMRAFIQTCETGKPAPTDIAEAIMVQQVLETMQTQLIDTSAASSNHQPVRPK